MLSFIRSWRAWRQSPSRADTVAVRHSPVTVATVPGIYGPLYGYLAHRYATTVVLTFLDIEALLGFPLPSIARSDGRWWTDTAASSDHHADAWGAADRRATPNLAARTVTFDRVV